MKSFDEFVKFINESESIQSTLLNVPLNIEPRMYDISKSADRSELIHAVEEQTLNQFMEILRSYHEWINEN